MLSKSMLQRLDKALLKAIKRMKASERIRDPKNPHNAGRRFALTIPLAERLRQDRAHGYTYKELANYYGISVGTAYNAVNRIDYGIEREQRPRKRS